MKEVQFGIPAIWADLQRKVRIAQGQSRPVKLTFRIGDVKHRAKSTPQALKLFNAYHGTEIMNRALNELAGIGRPKGEPRLVGRNIVVILVPWGTSL